MGTFDLSEKKVTISLAHSGGEYNVLVSKGSDEDCVIEGP